MLTHMHMVLLTWWCWHICKGERVGVDVDQLWDATKVEGWLSNGGQSAHEGRTVRDRSRELAKSLVGSRTVRPRWADGPPLCFKVVPERVSLWWGSKLNGGQSAHGTRTVRRLILDLYQRGCFSGLG